MARGAAAAFLSVVVAGALTLGPLCAQTPPTSTPAQTAARTAPPVSEAAPTPASRLPAVVSAARLEGSGDSARLVFDLTRPVEWRAFALADPYRVIIDLDEVRFHLPAGAGETARGVVSAFRFGLFAPGKSRIVIDLAGPAVIARAALTEAQGGEPPRLQIELRRADAETFRRAEAQRLAADRAASNLARRADREPTLRRSLPGGGEAGPPVIVLDPGHGGVDSGAAAPSGEFEKTIVLDFARLLRDKLVATGRFKVVMTRDRDVFVPLSERVRIARESRGALFVSIHADSISGAEDQARGVTLYTLSDRASDAESARLAERENKADAIAGLDLSTEADEVADILIDLTRRETRAFSALAARTLVEQLRPATRLHRLPLRSAGFIVLRAHDVPSVLVELGFVSSPRDLEMLTSIVWRERTTDAVVRAIDQFFAARSAPRPSAQR